MYPHPMKEYSGRLTVPQVSVNGVFAGGNDDLVAVRESAGKDGLRGTLVSMGAAANATPDQREEPPVSRSQTLTHTPTARFSVLSLASRSARHHTPGVRIALDDDYTVCMYARGANWAC